MKNKKKITKSIMAMAIGALLLAGCGSESVEEKEYRLVKLENYEGDVTLERSDEDTDIFEGILLQPKDTVTTGKNSEALFLIDSDKHISENANSSLSIKAKGDENKGSVNIELLYGDAVFVIDNKLNDKSSFEVKTPNATLSVRGTTFQVAYDKESNTTLVEVENGIVYADYEDGSQQDEEINAGEVRIITEDDVYDYIDESVWDTDFEIYEDILNLIDSDDDSDSDSDTDTVANNGTSFSPAGDNARDQYNDVISNMHSYVAQISELQDEYDQYDYMYFDYDQDGEKEVILYLRTTDDQRETYLDLCFLDYTPDKGVYKLATNLNDAENYCYYSDYNGSLVRYSWTKKTDQSFLYSVNISSGTLIYVLEESFDEVLIDDDRTGKPLPLYGEWEMLPED